MNLDAGHRQLHLYGRAFAATAAESSASISAVEQTRQVVPEYWREHSPAAVESIVEQYLDLDPRPTGIFVADDMQVAMIQPALQRRGVDISPGKVEIISCNHEEPYLVGLIPPRGDRHPSRVDRQTRRRTTALEIGTHRSAGEDHHDDRAACGVNRIAMDKRAWSKKTWPLK